jgi:hypothetical protein
MPLFFTRLLRAAIAFLLISPDKNKTMKFFLASIVCVLIGNSSLAQKTDSKVATADPNKKIQIVEASCGECQFKLPGKGCDLAVRVDGKAYFVDGTDIDSHGDAHANDGFCKAVRKAEVQGEVVNNRFKATYFKLIKDPAKKETESKQQN